MNGSGAALWPQEPTVAEHTTWCHSHSDRDATCFGPAEVMAGLPPVFVAAVQGAGEPMEVHIDGGDSDGHGFRLALSAAQAQDLAQLLTATVTLAPQERLAVAEQHHAPWCVADRDGCCLGEVDDTSNGSGVAVWLEGTSTEPVVRMDVPLSVSPDREDLDPATLTPAQALDIAVALLGAVRSAR